MAANAFTRIPAMEHRWGRRIRCGAPVRVTLGDGGVIPGRLRDVSMSGAFVEIVDAPPPLTHVEIRVVRSDGSETRLRGSVVRRDQAGVGIEWDEASPGAVCPVLGCATPCAAAAEWD